MADEETPDPGQAFAALMSSASAEAGSPPSEPWLNADGSHRYGSHPDGSPKKARGRPRKPPSVDELKAAAAEKLGDDGAPAAPAEDRAPSKTKRKGGTAKPGADVAVPQHRPGVITRGMNKRYRQLGKIVRAFDPDVGQALVLMATNTAGDPEPGQEPEDNSVGACWDDIARTNPKVRKVCLAMIQGGAWGALVMAHAPLFIAVCMKFVSENPGLIGRLILSWSQPDDDTAPGEGGLPGGMSMDDLGEVMKMADKLFPGMVPPGMVVPGEVIGENGTGPPRQARQQPGRNQQFARHGNGKKR